MRQHPLQFVVAVMSALVALPVAAAEFVFPSIDGGDIALDDWRGQPVLVVNTASLCAFTPQYEGLQALYDTYRDDGLVVLAVPSDSFRQELGDEAEVKEFCELTYGLDLPMTEITPVRGADAHPFYAWLEDQGVTPRWNFHKVLIGPDGEVLGDWGSTTRPSSGALTRAIEAALR
jgi:glutathione peroxidase